jgi:hypothetical protein
MSGLVSVFPNGSAGHTTVVFTSNTPISATSNQIVYVLQEDNTAVPPTWSGPARVLTGDGFLAIVPDGNSDQKWILKFSDRDVPPSLAKQTFQVFEIIGIARFGEKTPLTKDQITSLAATGRNCGAAPQVKTKEFSISDHSNSSARPLALGPRPSARRYALQVARAQQVAAPEVVVVASHVRQPSLLAVM